jgi:hypothetical protein
MANLVIKLFDKLYVGFQKRNTESGSPLGSLIPWGEDAASKKKMLQIDSWGDKKLKAVTLDNVPVSGFRISDSARQSSWGGDNTWIQIEDPRGFELFISVDNMVQIMNGNTIIDGEIKIPCVWGRDGSKNILLPVNSEPYKDAIENTERLKQTFNMRGVKPGNKLELKDGRVVVYYGVYYEIVRKQINEDKRQPNGTIVQGRQYEKISVSTQKQHVIGVIENKANSDFKPHLVVTKTIRVARQLSSDTMAHADAERHVNEHLKDPNTYRSCIGYTSEPELDFKIVIEPMTTDVLRFHQGTKNSWSTGKTIFIAKNEADGVHLLCDGSILIDTKRAHRHVPGMGHVQNDDRIYGRKIDIDQFFTGEFDFLQRHKNTDLAKDPKVTAYDENDLTYFQPYVIYTSKKTGVEHKMPY